jgi:DNA-binding CsgD family transcriptional regulator
VIAHDRRVPSRPDGLVDQLRRAVPQDSDLPTLAAAVFRIVGRRVPFDFACFATTDPATGLITWAGKSRSLGVGDEEFAATEYGPSDVNSFVELAGRRPPLGVLSIDTGGNPDACRRHRDFMAPRFGFTDELRAVLLGRGASWGALALYRGAGDPPFTAAEAALLEPALEPLAEAIQRSLFRRNPAGPAAAAPDGPAVLIVDADDRVVQLTPAAHAVIDELGGRDHGSLPSTVLLAVASTRTSGEATEARVPGATGRWVSLRSAPLSGADGRRDVVVTAESTPRAALSRLALAAHGLTVREEDVALLVLQGVDTRGIAAALHLSPHTVQDHLKVVFAKIGVTSRREMTARLVLG